MATCGCRLYDEFADPAIRGFQSEDLSPLHLRRKSDGQTELAQPLFFGGATRIPHSLKRDFDAVQQNVATTKNSRLDPFHGAAQWGRADHRAGKRQPGG